VIIPDCPQDCALRPCSESSHQRTPRRSRQPTSAAANLAEACAAVSLPVISLQPRRKVAGNAV